MFNPNDIKKMQETLTNTVKELQNIEKVTFPSLLEQANAKLPTSEKALFQEFAKESGKILNDVKTKSPAEITEALKNLSAKYEQRNNNTKGI